MTTYDIQKQLDDFDLDILNLYFAILSLYNWHILGLPYAYYTSNYTSIDVCCVRLPYIYITLSNQNLFCFVFIPITNTAYTNMFLSCFIDRVK